MYIIPILDECLALLLTGIEVLKDYLNVKITQLSVKIKNISEPSISESNPIGFVYEEGEIKGE